MNSFAADLNETRPAPAPRNIVDEIVEYLNTYMVFANPCHPRVIALWVLHTYTFGDSFPMGPMTTPYLYINSTEPGCGKTLLIDLLSPIARNSEVGADMTASVIFHLIESIRPSLFIDEVDTIWSGAKNEATRNVVNSGYKHSGYTWRQQGKETVKFRTFGPKLLAGIDNGHLPDTVASRSIEIMLEKVAKLNDEGQLVAPDGSTREIYYSFMAEEIAEGINRKIEAFIATWAANYSRYMPKPIPGLGTRQFEIAFPLLQVAHAVGIEEEAREWMKIVFTPKPAKDTPAQALLRSIRKAFDEAETDKLHSAMIVAQLNEEAPGWNTKLLSARLKGLVEGSPATIWIGNRQAKGYYRHQFEKAFAAQL